MLRAKGFMKLQDVIQNMKDGAYTLKMTSDEFSELYTYVEGAPDFTAHTDALSWSLYPPPNRKKKDI